MKKNRMMRIASFMLVLVLLTSSVISGTFAKYVTEETGMDSARVAKWGVAIEANGATFAEVYENTANDGGTTVRAEANLDGTTDNVVAPGSYGDLVAMELSGKPEVAFNVTYKATLDLKYWTVNGAEYCPIVFTVNGETYGVAGIKDYGGNALDNNSDNVADLIADVEAAIEDYSADYAANQDLSVETTVATPDVSWAWAFEGNDDDKDTALGDKAAAGTAPEIFLSITTTVTQID